MRLHRRSLGTSALIAALRDAEWLTADRGHHLHRKVFLLLIIGCVASIPRRFAPTMDVGHRLRVDSGPRQGLRLAGQAADAYGDAGRAAVAALFGSEQLRAVLLPTDVAVVLASLRAAVLRHAPSSSGSPPPAPAYAAAMKTRRQGRGRSFPRSPFPAYGYARYSGRIAVLRGPARGVRGDAGSLSGDRGRAARMFQLQAAGRTACAARPDPRRGAGAYSLRQPRPRSCWCWQRPPSSASSRGSSLSAFCRKQKPGAWMAARLREVRKPAFAAVRLAGGSSSTAWLVQLIAAAAAVSVLILALRKRPGGAAEIALRWWRRPACACPRRQLRGGDPRDPGRVADCASAGTRLAAV